MLIKSNNKIYSLTSTTISEFPVISKKILRGYGSNQSLLFSMFLNSKNYTPPVGSEGKAYNRILDLNKYLDIRSMKVEVK